MKSAEFEYRGEQFTLAVHDRDYISNLLHFAKRFFEIEILEYLAERFPKNRTIIDVGANIGNHALYFSRYLHPERLICFEPFALNFELLRRNLGSKAELHQIGLGNRERVVGLRYNPENMGISVLDENIPGTIQVKRLDDFALTDVSLIKVDVEGDDVEVLEGAHQTIQQSRPVLVVEGEFDRLFPVLSPHNYVCIAYWKQYQTYCFVPLR